MIINTINCSLTDFACDALIINLFEGVTMPGGGTGAVDRAVNGLISRTINKENFSGKLAETLILRNCKGIKSDTIVVVGLGKQADFGIDQMIKASSAAARECEKINAKKIGTILHGSGIGGFSHYESAKSLTIGSLLGLYRFDKHKTKEKSDNKVEEITIVEIDGTKISDIEKGISTGSIIGEAVNKSRDLSNEPSNYLNPKTLADFASDIAKKYNLSCTILDRESIEEKGMGLVSAVSRGSSDEPYFIDIRYTSPNAKKTVAIVGKGVTFDTGGYSLKTADKMYGMKDDMSGAAAVLCAMEAVGKAKPLVNVIAIVPAVTNEIGNKSIHPGDVFTSLSGQTVEINNTDAEGRLILADALTYAAREGADELIDIATLTGACIIALGRGISGIIGNDSKLVNDLIRCGAKCCEIFWQLPLYEDYISLLKSETADFINAPGQEGGAITAGLFISQFVENKTWAHLDLSSIETKTETLTSRVGSTGVGTGTLVSYLLDI
ncbi:MAG: leucyl aminopeptidase [Armatimonadota bacterium]